MAEREGQGVQAGGGGPQGGWAWRLPVAQVGLGCRLQVLGIGHRYSWASVGPLARWPCMGSKALNEVPAAPVPSSCMLATWPWGAWAALGIHLERASPVHLMERVELSEGKSFCHLAGF